MANNRISVLSPSLHLSVPNLTTLILTNNNITELGDLEPLKEVKGLKYLSLLGNPVQEKKWYREWLAWRIPGLRVLDFQRIRDKVRRLPRPDTARRFSIAVGTTSGESVVLDCRRTYQLPCYHFIDDYINWRCKERHGGRRASPCGCTRKSWSAFDERGSQQGQGGYCEGHFGRRNPPFREKLEGGLPSRHRKRGSIVVTILYILRTKIRRAHLLGGYVLVGPLFPVL